MKILHFDILEGFKKGGITQFENDNLNETYKIYLYKNKMRFDVDEKTIRLVMLDKNKAGQVLTLKKGETSNEIILPVTKELTKIDGIYDAQIIFTKNDGYNEKTIPFKITIKDDLLTDMEVELISKEEYQYLVDRFEEAIRNIEGFKNEISLQVTDVEKKLLQEKKEVLLREKTGILAQVEVMKQNGTLIGTTELTDLVNSETNYVSSINNLIIIIDKLIEERGKNNG